MEARTPAEILAFTSDIGVAKVNRSILGQVILSFMAGVFIAFAAQCSNMAAFNLLSKPETFGVGRLVAGFVFGIGLMMVLVAGAELFTGNNLIIVSILDKRIKVSQMLCNWVIVYIGNFVGSVLIAWMLSYTGLFNSGANLLGGMTIRIANLKVNYSFGQAFVLGILCNWLVCIAVWVSFAAKDVMGKFFSCFFFIGLFVCSGFEHSIANMYYVPAGLFAKANEAWVAASGVAADKIAALTWGSFFTKNLIPVTLGNIVGGVVCVGCLYWLSFRKKKTA